MSIRIPPDLFPKMAQGSFENGEYEKCLEFLKRCTPSERQKLKDMEALANYRLGQHCCTQEHFSDAKIRFSETNRLTSDASLKMICQSRLQLLNNILGRREYGRLPRALSDWGRACEDCDKAKSLYTCATCERFGSQVNLPRKIEVEDLQPEVTGIYCVGVYRSGWDRQRSNPFSVAIRWMKQRGAKDLVTVFGHMLADYMVQGEISEILTTIDFILPVPTSKSRTLQRGFGIPEVMVGIVGRRLAIAFFPDVLTLTRETTDLRNLSQSRRKGELTGAFKVSKPNLVRDRQVLVIDDVVTYGTTLCEIGWTLQEAGAEAVFGVVLAHTESSSWL